MTPDHLDRGPAPGVEKQPISLGEPIAVGRTAEIYAWREGQVLKLFFDWARGGATHEDRVARAVHDAGLPVPALIEAVEVGGRLGLVYERIEGRSMGVVTRERIWRLGRSARTLADLHVQMHAERGIPGLPDQQDRLQRKIERAKGLPAHLRQAALDALGQMPRGDRLCHGDFHPENVLLAAGRPVVIDWVDATVGRPWADVARSAVLLGGASAAKGTDPPLLRLAEGWFRRIYVDRYFRLCPGGKREYRAWLPIVAAARMSEGIGEIEGWLCSQVQRGLG